MTARTLSLVLALFVLSACEALPLPEPAPATETRPPAPATDSPTLAPTIVSFPTIPPPPPPFGAMPTAARPSNAPPLAQIVSPAANAQFSLNQTITLVAYAASENGIARVEFFDDNAPVRTETLPAPAAATTIFAWTPAQIGSHVLRVVAYDTNNLASVADEVTVSVVNDARRPVANILYPIGTPQIELGTVVSIFGAASDEVSVTQLELWVDNQLHSYVTATPTGQNILANVFQWHALLPGAHTLFLRARDNQDQTTDSAPVRVSVADSRATLVTLTLERAVAPIGEPLTITVSALDPNGIQRIELWSAGQISNTVVSSQPTRQTALTMQYVWTSASAGEFVVSARAYNASGNSKETTPQTLIVLRPGQATPTRAPTATATRTRAPRATPTARLQPPAPPSAQIVSPAERFTSAPPLRVSFSGQGNAELERIELWGYGQGQASPQVICSIEARTTTQRTAQCDWAPPAGVVYLFASAIDSYRQVGKSPTISGVVGLPALASPTPTPPPVAGRWSASTPGGQLVLTLRQVGGALRGEFKSPSDGEGRITSGLVKTGSITFHVEFGTGTPPAPASALDVECNMDAGATTLDCTYKDSRGRGNSAIFRRESAP